MQFVSLWSCDLLFFSIGSSLGHFSFLSSTCTCVLLSVMPFMLFLLFSTTHTCHFMSLRLLFGLHVADDSLHSAEGNVLLQIPD